MNDPSTASAALDIADVAIADRLTNPNLDSDYELLQQILVDDDEHLPDMENTGPPGGGTAFDSRDYATIEEADTAMEAFLMKALGVSDEHD